MATIAVLDKTDDWVTIAARHAASELFPRSASNRVHASHVIEKHMRAAVALARKTDK